MNGVDMVELDEPSEDLDEDLESDDEYDESIDDEAEFLPIPGLFPFPPFGGKRSPRTGSGRGYSGFASGMFATKAEVRRGFARVGADIRKNGAAIKTVNTRLNGVQKVASAQGKQIVQQAKVNARQGKELVALRRDLKKAREMSLMTLLLSRPKSTEPTTAAHDIEGANIPANSRLLYEDAKSNSLLLPLLLMGGLDGGGGSDGLFLALALSGAL